MRCQVLGVRFQVSGCSKKYIGTFVFYIEVQNLSLFPKTKLFNSGADGHVHALSYIVLKL